MTAPAPAGDAGARRLPVLVRYVTEFCRPDPAAALRAELARLDPSRRAGQCVSSVMSEAVGPERAMAAIVERLDLEPHDLRAGYLVVASHDPDGAADTPLGEPTGTRRFNDSVWIFGPATDPAAGQAPLAEIEQGLSLDEAKRALEALRRAGRRERPLPFHTAEDLAGRIAGDGRRTRGVRITLNGERIAAADEAYPHTEEPA